MFYVTLNWDGCRLCQEDWAKIRNEFNSLNCRMPRAEFMLLTRVTSSRFSLRLLGTFVTKRNIKVKKNADIFFEFAWYHSIHP